jgi:hypothetical protein
MNDHEKKKNDRLALLEKYKDQVKKLCKELIKEIENKYEHKTKKIDCRLASHERFRERVKKFCKQLIINAEKINEIDPVLIFDNEGRYNQDFFCISKSDSSEDMDNISFIENTDPPLGSGLSIATDIIVKTAAMTVWEFLKNWLNEKENPDKKNQGLKYFLRLTHPKTIRNILFKRDLKALNKYGDNLRFNEGPNSYDEAINKLSDAVYFIAKGSQEDNISKNKHLTKEQLEILTDLHNVLNSFILDCKKKNL